jgi:hypothetical protein
MKDQTRKEVRDRSGLAAWIVAVAVVVVLAVLALFHWIDSQGSSSTSVRSTLIVRPALVSQACEPIGFCLSKPPQGDRRAPAF